MSEKFISRSVLEVLSASGILSRREAKRAVAAGRVTRGNLKITDPFAPGAPENELRLDGKELPSPHLKIYQLLYKPRGWICSTRDAFSDRLAIRLLPQNLPRCFSAGRLDAESEGMLVFTNDGALVHHLENPASNIEKEYHVKTARPLSPEMQEILRRGIIQGGERLCPQTLEELSPGTYRVCLTEGRRHEIRRMIQYAGTTVRRLIRIRIGNLELGTLLPGESRELRPEEVAALQTSSLPPPETRQGGSSQNF